MSAYCHRREFQLRYTDFDAFDRIRLSSLLSLAQEGACSSADELGFGYETLKKKGLAFITVHTVGKLLGNFRLGDEVVLKTWPLPPRHVIFERDYLVENREGELLAKMASRWCLVDLETFSLQAPESLGEAHEKCPYNPQNIFNPAVNWQIKKLENEAEHCFNTTVGASRLDHYFHLNNTFYADLFMDCFRLEELCHSVSDFQIAYINQAKEGEELSFFKRREGESTICEARCGSETISRFRMRLSDSSD